MLDPRNDLQISRWGWGAVWASLQSKAWGSYVPRARTQPNLTVMSHKVHEEYLPWELSHIHPGVSPRAVVPALAPEHRCPHGGLGGISPAVAPAPLSLSRPTPGRSDGISRGLLHPCLCGCWPSMQPAPVGPRLLSCLAPFWILIGVGASGAWESILPGIS